MSAHNPGMEYDELESGDGAALTEEDLSDEAVEGETRAAALEFLGGVGEAVEGRVMTNEEHVAALRTWHESERADILRENAETRADLGLDDHQPPHIKHGIPDWGPPPDNGLFTTTSGDTADSETGEVLKDAPGWADGQIQTVDGLDWAGEKLSEVSAVIRENERLRDAAVERLQRRIDLLKARTTDINSPLVMRREFFETAIRVYADSHRADILRGLRKGAKSRAFPSGLRLAWRTEAKGGAYRWDEKMKESAAREALADWAAALDEGPEAPQPPLAPMEPRPDLARIKRYLAERDKAFGADGSVDHAPPGLEYVPEHEELSVNVEGDK